MPIETLLVRADVTISAGDYLVATEHNGVMRANWLTATHVVGIATHHAPAGSYVTMEAMVGPAFAELKAKLQATFSGVAPTAWIASGMVNNNTGSWTAYGGNYNTVAEVPPVIETFELGGCFVVASPAPKRRAWLGRRLRDGETAAPMDADHPFAGYIAKSPQLGGLTWMSVSAKELMDCDSERDVFRLLAEHAQAWAAGPVNEIGRRIVVGA